MHGWEGQSIILPSMERSNPQQSRGFCGVRASRPQPSMAFRLVRVEKSGVEIAENLGNFPGVSVE